MNLYEKEALKVLLHYKQLPLPEIYLLSNTAVGTRQETNVAVFKLVHEKLVSCSKEVRYQLTEEGERVAFSYVVGTEEE